MQVSLPKTFLRTRSFRFSIVKLCAAISAAWLSSAFAAAQAQGTPPPDATALVAAPTASDAPKFEKNPDGTTASLAAGGQGAAGNTRQFAATANGAIDTRWHDNGLGASLLGNYGHGAPPGQPSTTTAENVQGRIRYERYLIDQASLFLLNTGRHDKLQGLAFRYNLDPGFKYLAVSDPSTALWGEIGYDLQYDVRLNSALMAMDGTSVAKHATDHSGRLYVGFKYAFNQEVTLSTGVEYLQSFVHSTGYRINYDALFAAKVVGGLAVGVGFSTRFDHAPLPDKKKVDLSTTLSLIYAYSSVQPPPPPPPPPCPPAAPEQAPEATTAPALVAPPPPPPAASAPLSSDTTGTPGANIAPPSDIASPTPAPAETTMPAPAPTP